MTSSHRILAASLALVLSIPAAASGQDRPARFQPREQPTEVPVTVFHSPQSANLPTAETLSAREMQFEVSHRFLPAISDGIEALWGLDGPVFNRLGISYALTDDVMVGVLRSNLDDNVDLNAKAKVLSTEAGSLPVMVGLAGGVAFNNVGSRPSFGVDENEVQAYGQVIVNALVGERLALGAVPSILHNVRIERSNKESTLALGLNGQLYFAEQASLFGEWVVTAGRVGLEHDPVTMGLELETGGHFFKLVVTNTARMNPAQHLGGTPFSFAPDEWRVGFNITRLLVFWGE